MSGLYKYPVTDLSELSFCPSHFLLLSLRAACHRPLSSLLFDFSTLTLKPPCQSTQTFEELKLLNFLPPRLNSPRTAYRHQITSHISRGSSFLGSATDTFLYRSSRPRSAPRNSLAGFTTSLQNSTCHWEHCFREITGHPKANF